MNIYIWKEIEHLTLRWHSRGGLVITANSLDEAKAIASAKDVMISDKDALPLVLPVVCEKNYVFIFPDAGCC